jgi:ABC-type multidrug transport system fused ATPase/permease subunit
MAKQFFFLFLILSLAIAPSVLAITLQDTNLYSEDINLNVTIGNNPVYCDIVEVNESYQSLTNCRLNEADLGDNYYFTDSGTIDLWNYISENLTPCSPYTNTGVDLIVLLTSLALPIIALSYIYSKNGAFEITLGNLVLMFMAIVLAVSFFLIIAQQAGGIC